MTPKQRVIFLPGTVSHLNMMNEVALHLKDWCACVYSPFFADGLMGRLVGSATNPRGLLSWNHASAAHKAIRERGLAEDMGVEGTYDLSVVATDLILPKKLRRWPLLLLQEGMTDPETWAFNLVRTLSFPRWMASTAAIGLSHAYERFCVASEGYRDFFVRKGVSPEKLVVTGLPAYDEIERYRDNDFPLRGYVLAATSDTRETFKFDDRRAFIRRVLKIADGRPIVFKLHPNENFARSRREIERLAPRAEIFQQGPTAEMIANCDVLITQYSTIVYIGLILGKECHSYFDLEELKRLLPLQNGGRSAARIAEVCRGIFSGRPQ
jgi:hypothetical protein